MTVFYYNGIKKIYFNKIIDEIISVASLHDNKSNILDFGCGSKQLQTRLNKKIFNYDINPLYSDFADYSNLDFDIVIFNHVFMYMTQNEIKSILGKIKQKNKFCKIVIGISRVSLINKIASWITFNFYAHKGVKSNSSQQLKTLLSQLELISKRTVYNMTDIYYCKFK